MKKIKIFDIKLSNERVINKWLKYKDVEDIQISDGIIMVTYNENLRNYCHSDDTEDREMLFP